jgi:hypothetical protein
MLELARIMKDLEAIRQLDEFKTTIKIFVCNKYEQFSFKTIDKANYCNYIDELIREDEQCRKIYNIIKRFFPDETIAKENLFFISCKYNLGVEFVFDTIVDRINQKELIKNGNVSESSDSEHSNHDNDVLNETVQDLGYFCYKKIEKPKDVANKKFSTQNYILKFIDYEEAEEDNLDNFQIEAPYKNIQKKDINEKSKCSII